MKSFKHIVFMNVLLIALIPPFLDVLLHLFEWSRGLPQNGWAGGVQTTWGHAVHLNSWNFREREFAPRKANGSFRIMVFGDSLTWGVGLSVDQRYTELLQQWLEHKHPEIYWEVLNFGIDGQDTTREAKLLYNMGKFVEPDLVVVGFCFNDPTSKSQEYSPERAHLPLKYPVVSKVATTFGSMGYVLLGEALEKSAYHLAEWIGIVPPWPDSLDRAYHVNSEDWRNYTHALANIHDLSIKLTSRRPMMIVLNQVIDESTRIRSRTGLDEKLNRWYGQVLDAAVDAGFIVADCADLISSDHPLSWYVVNPADHHPSAEMNRIYAERLYQMINMHPDMGRVLFGAH